MAVVISHKCSACRRQTWHVFEPRLLPGASFWKCRECGNRRFVARSVLDPSALRHRSRVQTEHACFDAFLEDLSGNGAKLRLPDDATASLQTGQHIFVNPQLHPSGPLSRQHPATIRWVSGREFGVSFDTPLPLSDADIPRIIKN